MTSKRFSTLFRRVGLFSTVLLSAAILVAQQPPPPPDQAQAPPQQLLSPEQLDSLVAPVALYPDALLGQILVAATYPAEIADAGQWLNQNRGLQGQQLIGAAQQQNWDPSIQALVAFPDVIGRLNADMRWTTDLGNAFLAQQADVMAAVQRLRAQAVAAGHLNSNAQETVTTDYQGGQEAIEIAPANPEVVYVPTYNPVYVWGAPAWGYYPDWCDFGFGFGFGPGIYVNAFFGGLPWGGWGWGCNWFGGFLYTRPFFFEHCGFRGYVGGRAWGSYNVWAHNGYHRLGVAYPNGALTARYGAISSSRGGFSNVRMGTQPVSRNYQSFSARNGTSPSNGWSHFNGTPATGYRTNPARPATAPNYSANRGSAGYPHVNSAPAYRPTAPLSRGYTTPVTRPSTSYNRSYSAPTYRPSPSSNRSYSAPTYRPSPSYNRSYSAPTYRPSPSYNRSYSAPTYRPSPSYNRSYSAPTYRPSPSYNRSYSAPSYHSAPSFSHSNGGGGYSAPRSSSGGSSFHSSGGGGGYHGSSSGGGSHNSGHR